MIPKMSEWLKSAGTDESVDLSKVGAGARLLHKSFGKGIVKKIDSGMIVVNFNGVERKFQFPNAFYDGYLKSE